jgi:hypothetical protein
MKNFKPLFYVIIFVFSINISLCQVIKFKTTSASSCYLIEKTRKWGNWEDATNGKDILISFDITNERIKIYSKVEQIFDIIKYYDKTTDSDNDDVIGFQCIDKDGSKCKIRLVTLKSQENRKQLYVGYSDITFLYNIYNLD